MEILIAEDEPTSQIILSSALQLWGYEVICTTNGQEALAILSNDKSPQIALIDWMMPKLDGLSLCKKLRTIHPHKPLYIVLLTHRDSREDIVEGLEAGADDYILKPFQPDELKARINVGRRIINMHYELLKQHKFQGGFEMAGTICHEINQPLQIISGYNELLLREMSNDAVKSKMLEGIKQATKRIGAMTERIMTLTSYHSKSYIGGENSIIDVERCSIDNEGNEQ